MTTHVSFGRERRRILFLLMLGFGVGPLLLLIGAALPLKELLGMEGVVVLIALFVFGLAVWVIANYRRVTFGGAPLISPDDTEALEVFLDRVGELKSIPARQFPKTVSPGGALRWLFLRLRTIQWLEENVDARREARIREAWRRAVDTKALSFKADTDAIGMLGSAITALAYGDQMPADAFLNLCGPFSDAIPATRLRSN